MKGLKELKLPVGNEDASGRYGAGPCKSRKPSYLPFFVVNRYEQPLLFVSFVLS